MSNSRRNRPDPDEQHARQRESRAEQSAMQAASQVATRAATETHHNPEFLAQLQDPGADSEAYPWLESEAGPALAGANILGQRSPSYEQQIKWLDRNRAERHLAEGQPGRLCQGATREIAMRTLNRTDKTAKDPYTTDERRALRQLYHVATTQKSLSIGARGLRSVADATAVSKVEKHESDTENGLRERMGRWLA